MLFQRSVCKQLPLKNRLSLFGRLSCDFFVVAFGAIARHSMNTKRCWKPMIKIDCENTCIISCNAGLICMAGFEKYARVCSCTGDIVDVGSIVMLFTSILC